MKISLQRLLRTVALFAAIGATGCAAATTESGPGTVQPGAPGEEGRPVGAADAARVERPRHTEADVRFMQGMIPHHMQALEMTALVPTRSSRNDIRLMAERIEASQDDEIAVMRRWLEERGEEVPGPHAHHAHHGHDGHHALMPGMLTQEELERLRAATGAEFDRLFLEFMIRHHEGALIMVEELFASPGAGQESEIYQFASHVDSDQRIEIARMQRMLSAAR